MGLCGTSVGRGNVRSGAGRAYNLFKFGPRFVLACGAEGAEGATTSDWGDGADVVSAMMEDMLPRLHV